MADPGILERSRTAGTEEALRALHPAGEPLPPPEQEEAFGNCFDRFGEARVVLLGEATHGTAEFYRARAAITRRLIERHGFSIVAVEADWPDAGRIDRYVRHRAPEPSPEAAFARFPSWMWRNREVLHFVEWLRRHNEARPERERAEFRGLDVYSLGQSIGAVLRYLEEVDPEAARVARKRYGCLTPWQAEPEHYGRAVLHGASQSCEDAAIAQLRELLDHRVQYLGRDGEGFLDAAQNARIVRSAEGYYRAMYRGGAESWNLRDRHMFDTLRAVLEARGPDAKAVVWAHNSHIGNASATAMGWSGEFNIGELCRTAFGADAALIGFGTDRGTVAAADDWDGPMRVMEVLPARPDSYEHLFRRAGLARSLTDLRGPGRAALREALLGPRLERAIGVIYRPDTEFYSHYFEAVLPEQFDAVVWFEQTQAVTPLDTEPPRGMPDTYPFGI
ncbi:erythromycin esterase family protein [Roseomonas sp. BN140053]|uniref:erythromycin esterase family protein n=1 Tax=Roseomonas sp. BN140053 TaxID=3391898 RepID=UPI0039ED3D30